MSGMEGKKVEYAKSTEISRKSRGSSKETAPQWEGPSSDVPQKENELKDSIRLQTKRMESLINAGSNVSELQKSLGKMQKALDDINQLRQEGISDPKEFKIHFVQATQAYQRFDTIFTTLLRAMQMRKKFPGYSTQGTAHGTDASKS